jgi:acetolactate synthase I/II/III large subunit
MARSQKGINRRGFLKGAAAGAAASAATIVTGTPASAQQAPSTAPTPSQAQLAREAGPVPATVNSRIIENPGSDYMVDVYRALGIEYVAANPGSSFEGLQESFVNYGNNKPEFLTCLHEEYRCGDGSRLGKN